MCKGGGALTGHWREKVSGGSWTNCLAKKCECTRLNYSFAALSTGCAHSAALKRPHIPASRQTFGKGLVLYRASLLDLTPPLFAAFLGCGRMGKANAPRQGRAGFLNAAKSAAITETIRKEERAVYNMLQRQIELGHITLPDGEAQEEQPVPTSKCDPATAEVNPKLIERLLGRQGEADKEEDPARLSKDRLLVGWGCI
jgi:hypothetical protein